MLRSDQIWLLYSTMAKYFVFFKFILPILSVTVSLKFFLLLLLPSFLSNTTSFAKVNTSFELFIMVTLQFTKRFLVSFSGTKLNKMVQRNIHHFSTLWILILSFGSSYPTFWNLSIHDQNFFPYYCLFEIHKR